MYWRQRRLIDERYVATHGESRFQRSLRGGQYSWGVCPRLLLKQRRWR